METQTTLAVPDEDGCMTVYTSCQAPETTQEVIATCLNLPFHNMRVITRRLGGSFGGKAMRHQNIAVAVALAAYKLRRPVRVSLDRNTDMQMIGGRSPMTAKYTVGFTKTGKITGLKVDLLIEGGWCADMSTFIPMTTMPALKKYDVGRFDIACTVCKTNNVPKTSVRAPGEAQGSLIADAVLDQVASYLGASGGDKVRDENLHTAESIKLFQGEATVGDVATGFTLPGMWHQIKASSRKEEREKEIAKFNEQSQWLKRGLELVPSVFRTSVVGNVATVSIFQDGSIVAEVGGVEMGQGLYTKARQAAAYTLSPLWTKVEGAFVQGIGFFLTEEILRDAKGKLLSDGTWTYKPPTIDTIPQRLNVELYNSPEHKYRVLSSKGIHPKSPTEIEGHLDERRWLEKKLLFR